MLYLHEHFQNFTIFKDIFLTKFRDMSNSIWQVHGKQISKATKMASSLSYCNGCLECRGNFTPQPTPFFWFSLRFLVLQQGGQMLFCHIGTHVNLLYSQQDCSGVPAKTTHLSTELGSHCKLLSFSPLDVDHIQVRTLTHTSEDQE